MLIAALKNPAAYPHAVDELELIETHISWVILTGQYAYKIKKPVNLGFLDFSTLEQRRFYCEEELRLNRRFAPQIYLDVVAITGTPSAPQLGSDGMPFEYALKLAQFPQSLRADRLLEQEKLNISHIDKLAAIIAHFHRNAQKAPLDKSYGDSDTITASALDNFIHSIQIDPHVNHNSLFRTVQKWTEQRCQELIQEFSERKANGFVRECHGDLHLANIVLLNGSPVMFDCIEFSEALRWIDVQSDIAFLCMDLDYRLRPDLSWRFLNAYLEHTGDYSGLCLMPFYQCYRAVVRAKVALIMFGAANQNDFDNYLRLAHRYTYHRPNRLFITHGLSGSGKTRLSQFLLERHGIIRIRSDIERKRLFYNANTPKKPQAPEEGIYSDDASLRTYQHLATLARKVLHSGYSVIIDAAFLKRHQRDLLHTLAIELGIAFTLIELQAPEELLRSRILQRMQKNQDASDANLDVLEYQIATAEPLAESEKAHTITFVAEKTDFNEISNMLSITV